MMAAPGKVRQFLTSIRGKIALACLGVCMVVAAIGTFGVFSMARSGALVVETYDKPLMAISFARAIHADFADLQSVAVRLNSEGQGAQADEIAARVEELSKLLHDDLSVAASRATSDRVRRSVSAVTAAVADWRVAEAALRAAGSNADDWARLDAAAASVREEIDLLVNYAAGDGFLQRKQALATIDLNRDVQIAGVVLAALATSMTIMRDNIRTMMEREIAQRRSAQMRLADAIESSTEGFVLIDAERNVLLSNREIEDFCGGPANAPRPGDTLDEAAARVVSGGVFALRSEQQKAEMLIKLRMLDAMDVEAPLADGRWVRLSRSSTSDGGAIFVVSDITLLKERERLLRETAQRAEAANKAKSEFLATMSHELRTPLNSVIGFSEIISSEALGPVGEPQYREYAGEILSSGKGLLKIINDILMLVKSESGELALEADAIDLGELLEECADSMGVTFAQAKVTLELGPVVGPCFAMGDRVRLRQAVLNLMSNAAKFTPEGGTARLSAFCAADKQVAISISDSGIGMREEDIPAALAPFGQIDSSRSRRYEGTGLGLTLARAIVELHCGEMRIDSTPGQGTTVAIFLPAADMEVDDGLRKAS